MKRLVGASALLLVLPAFSADNQPGLAFELSGVQVGRIVNVIYSDALKVPYVLSPELLADQRAVSFRIAGSAQRVKSDLTKLLDSLGYEVQNRDGLEFIGPKREPAVELEAYVYKPRFRDVGYLADLLRPLFKGQFTVNRPVAAPIVSKSDSSAPPGSASLHLCHPAPLCISNGYS